MKEPEKAYIMDLSAHYTLKRQALLYVSFLPSDKSFGSRIN